tara:strand:- start:14646 stop:15176 length:531 start_codon:yes stop_codon:yes gene_type:complete
LTKNKTKISVLKSNEINENILNQIFLLKKQHYKFSIISQKKWFIKNIKPADHHIVLFNKKKLIGYNVLRKRNAQVLFRTSRKKINFLLFDTLIIDKMYRKKNLSKKIILKSNFIIKKNKTFSILICLKKMINYYQRYNWRLLDKKRILFKNLKFNKYAMIYNQEKFILEDSKIKIL